MRWGLPGNPTRSVPSPHPEKLGLGRQHPAWGEALILGSMRSGFECELCHTPLATHLASLSLSVLTCETGGETFPPRLR